MFSKFYFFWLLLFTTLSFQSLVSDQAEMKFQTANDLYNRGLQASTLLERQQLLNDALSIYLGLEKNPSEELYITMGDIYYQLNEYSWAILYYQRALQINRTRTTQQSLQTAQQKLGLFDSEEPYSLLNQILSFNNYLSLSLRLKGFFLLTLLTFIICSLALWLSTFFWRKLAFIFFFLDSLVLLNLIMSFYFTPIEAILILPTGFYQSPDMHKQQLTSDTLVKGIKVIVIEASGDWLKIIDSKGTIGYVPASVIRII